MIRQENKGGLKRKMFEEVIFKVGVVITCMKFYVVIYDLKKVLLIYYENVADRKVSEQEERERKSKKKLKEKEKSQ